MNEQTHASVLLEHLIEEVPAEYFTLEWFMQRLPEYSFGCIFLFLGLLTLLPFISVIARILIIILTWQVILGYDKPRLPTRLMKRKLPSKYLIRLKRRAIPALRQLEVFVQPRWPVMLHGTRRLTAFIAMVGMGLSLLLPFPLANMPPAVVGIFMALSYIEQDGLMLFLAFIAAFLLFLPIAIIGYSFLPAAF